MFWWQRAFNTTKMTTVANDIVATQCNLSRFKNETSKHTNGQNYFYPCINSVWEKECIDVYDIKNSLSSFAFIFHRVRSEYIAF